MSEFDQYGQIVPEEGEQPNQQPLENQTQYKHTKDSYSTKTRPPRPKSRPTSASTFGIEWPHPIFIGLFIIAILGMMVLAAAMGAMILFDRSIPIPTAIGILPTDTPTPTVTPESTSTPVPTNSATPTPTETLLPPTNTFTPTPTETLLPPTNTFTPTPTETPPPPTNTFTPTPTETPPPPTNTFTPPPTFTFTPPPPPTITPTPILATFIVENKGNLAQDIFLNENLVLRVQPNETQAALVMPGTYYLVNCFPGEIPPCGSTDRYADIYTSYTFTIEPTSYSGYTTIYDDSFTLVMDVPVEWQDIDGRASDWQGIPVVRLTASSNLGGFFSSYSTPGIELFASKGLAQTYSPIDILNWYSTHYDRDCIYQGNLDDYSNPLYTIYADLYTNCNQEGNVIVVVATPADQSSIIFIQVQAAKERDFEALSYIVSSMDALGDLPY
ncbi:MAG: hypothetical protein KDJ52_09830 [Anaerolineae bacterium]|nr:hypothetical protein [Anaerolineae bacterium]